MAAGQGGAGQFGCCALAGEEGGWKIDIKYNAVELLLEIWLSIENSVKSVNMAILIQNIRFGGKLVSK